jgi:hypothetical protein
MKSIDSLWKLLTRPCSLAAIALLLVFISSAQTHAGVSSWDMSGVKIKSIRQLEDAAALKGNPNIEIELHNTQRFHIGDLNWCLQIGSFQVQRPTRRSTDHRSLTYVLGFNDWNNLKDGDPVYLIWGYYDAKEKGVRPFAHLNKKMLRKTPRKKH